MPTITLYAPDNYPRKQNEIRSYTVAAFQVVQRTDQLSLVRMRKDMLRFLIKEKAFGYWIGKGWLQDDGSHATLLAGGLVTCQQARANQLPGYNAGASEIDYWTKQFTENSALPRSASFSV